MEIGALIPFAIAGLSGAVHCAGMCGGIVGAMTVPARQARLTGRVIAIQPAVVPSSDASMIFMYNAGRLASYMTAGTMAGAAGGAAKLLGIASILQASTYWLTNLLLVVVGVSLMGRGRMTSRIERIGLPLWRRVQPAIRRLMPADTCQKQFLLGALWGWVPCGMVYTMLLAAAMSGDSASGAMILLAFGIGTLPALTMLSLAGVRLSRWLRLPWIRTAAGITVILFGVTGMLRAWNGILPHWLATLCTVPGGSW